MASGKTTRGSPAPSGPDGCCSADPAGRPGARRLTLDLRFPRQPAISGPVSVHVVVEDVGEADAHAPRLYETEVTGLSIGPDGQVAPLELSIPESAAIAGAVAPAIRVHVDRGATGTMTAGDFINPAIVPLPSEAGAKCDVPLVEVGENG